MSHCIVYVHELTQEAGCAQHQMYVFQLREAQDLSCLIPEEPFLNDGLFHDQSPKHAMA